MTEEEARKKLCFRAATFGASQQLSNGPGPLCVATDCMAWRKIPGGSKFKDARTGRLSDCDQTGNGTWIESGYCGLAGRPDQ